MDTDPAELLPLFTFVSSVHFYVHRRFGMPRPLLFVRSSATLFFSFFVYIYRRVRHHHRHHHPSLSIFRQTSCPLSLSPTMLTVLMSTYSLYISSWLSSYTHAYDFQLERQCAPRITLFISTRSFILFSASGCISEILHFPVEIFLRGCLLWSSYNVLGI